MILTIEKNEDLGYDDFFEAHRVARSVDDRAVARVTAEHKGSYTVKTINAEYTATISGKMSFEATIREDYPAVGDWVLIDIVDKDKAVIHDILPRRSVLKRKYSGKDEVQIIAANVDYAFITESIGRDHNINRLERYCAVVRDSGVLPIVILNKIDLIAKDDKGSIVSEIKDRMPTVDVMCTSTVTGEGLKRLQGSIKKGKTYCFLGSSGVGKSSLINALIDSEKITVSAIGKRSRRGKHTTTQREMYFLDNGGIVIDNPGMREIGLTDLSAGIDRHFDAIAQMAQKCKFADCTHTHEPGCAVLHKAEQGNIDEEEYANYVALKKEAAHYGMTKGEKRKKDKKLGKFFKTTKEELKRYGHKDYDI
jgi:ribosome biogenesis GTPase